VHIDMGKSGGGRCGFGGEGKATGAAVGLGEGDEGGLREHECWVLAAGW
jgi:hypothetical protein